MKLSYSLAEVECWRDKAYHRTEKLAVRNEQQALLFVDKVGFCLATKCDGVSLPNFWDAVIVGHAGGESSDSNSNNGNGKRNYHLSYAREIRNILPNHNSVYYGKVFKRRPTLISREYFPYFYALTERTGESGEYISEHAHGKISGTAKTIMDVLMKSSPMTSKDLRKSIHRKSRGDPQSIEKALDELHRKMFISRVVGGQQLGTEWSPVIRSFSAEVRKARKISKETARCKLLDKYFQNQLVSSIEAIQKVFGWSRQTIYHTIGQLVHLGVITTTVGVDGKKDSYYCLIY